ncbi:helix-turn-helix transcriptional regulator [Streptomyces sp. NBC_00237]|uniref:helix-turn-helix domain-containing protein n=1 Tax=Streptomyces sp. NBC_00237 TaxID=2975687 RepID=UPI0022535325|nr:helix-turn-helix transcriptional regulator [Streptomyces sp. NBC_00237]MCX5201919.1 helix-turn-helix transcriptional regulator [Streptomyces sp. NBC_00237]
MGGGTSAGGRVPTRWSEAVRERRGAGRTLLRTQGLTVTDIHCCEDRTGFVGPGYEGMYGVALTRAGGYLRRVNGEEFFVDVTGGYLLWPGDEHHIAHPAGPGDRSTILQVDMRLFADRFDRRPAAPHRPNARGIALDGAADLRHRALVAAAHRGTDAFELTERTHALLDGVAASAGQWTVRGSGGPATVRAHRKLAADACAALTARTEHLPVLTLDELARTVGASPHHLSRVFRAVTGRTLTAHRNQLRVRAVLNVLAEGGPGPGLRALAATYGFADQAHLTRVVRQYTGAVPSSVRRQLAPVESVRRQLAPVESVRRQLAPIEHESSTRSPYRRPG